MQQTEIQRAQLEALKKFPEMILKVETETVAICDRMRREDSAE